MSRTIMHAWRRTRAHAFLTIVAALALSAQEDMPPARAGFGGRSIRDFLGLGAPPDPAAAARGETLYAANCGFCHGDKARGGEGPNLVRSALVLHDEKGDLIGPLVAKGRPDQGMPAFPTFTKDQLGDVAQYLHLQVELVANRGSYQRLNVVTGNAKAGETYFKGAGGCTACHSVTGDLAHVGTKYQPDQLQNRFVWPGGFGYDGGGAGRSPIKVTLPSGETISGKVKHLDDFNVSMIDAAGNYHSWPRQGIKVEVEDRLAGHRKLLGQYTDADMHNLTAYLVTLK